MVYLLTCLGVTPFVFLIALSWFQPSMFDFYSRGLVIYTSVIATFIAGSHWGIVLGHASRWPWLVLSNLIALLCCLALWVGHGYGLWISGGCIILLLIAEYGLLQRHWIVESYWNLRLMVTLIVVVSLLFFGVR